jgi:hypothetical protein
VARNAAAAVKAAPLKTIISVRSGNLKTLFAHDNNKRGAHGPDPHFINRQVSTEIRTAYQACPAGYSAPENATGGKKTMADDWSKIADRFLEDLRYMG